MIFGKQEKAEIINAFFPDEPEKIFDCRDSCFFSECKQLIRVEIQIRTVAMDFWANLEHRMKYKSDAPIPEELNFVVKKL